jgi:hypothetical protein
MIQKDMLSRKVIGYQIKDEVLTDPKRIKVGANEVVYVCYCSIEPSGDFILKLASGTDVVTYHSKNTVLIENSNYSSQITSHWSNIHIVPSKIKNYFIRIIRITILKYQPNEES